MNCENCGIADGAYSSPGCWLRLKFRPKPYTMQHKSHVVWTCGSACAVETIAIAAMGLPSHLWPMKLKQFAKRLGDAGKLTPLGGQTGGQTTAKTPINIDYDDVLLNVLATTLPELPDGGTNPARSGGRPRTLSPSKQTLKKRRQRARAHFPRS